MDVGASFVSRAESALLMQPGDRSFHHPSGFSQAAAMFGVSMSHNGLDAATTQLPFVRLRAVSAIALQRLGSAARTARLSGHRRHGVDQRQELSDVVRVGGCEHDG